jgi:hypothetical protein
MTKYLYHYTDESCLEDILKTRIIRASKNTLFGEGIYLCDLSPADNEEATILLNNYGSHKKGITGKADCYFKFKKNQLKGVYCRTLKKDGRVIWRYPKKTINLDAVWFDYGYTDSSTGPMKKQQHPCHPQVVKEKNKASQPKAEILKKKKASTSQQQKTTCVKPNSCYCSACMPQCYIGSKQPSQSNVKTETFSNHFKNPQQYSTNHSSQPLKTSYKEPSNNYTYVSHVSDFAPDYCYEYFPRSQPKKEPKPDSWGTLIAIGIVTVIGYKLVSYFSK